jgi:hypothetical protein
LLFAWGRPQAQLALNWNLPRSTSHVAGLTGWCHHAWSLICLYLTCSEFPLSPLLEHMEGPLFVMHESPSFHSVLPSSWLGARHCEIHLARKSSCISEHFFF